MATDRRRSPDFLEGWDGGVGDRRSDGPLPSSGVGDELVRRKLRAKTSAMLTNRWRPTIRPPLKMQLFGSMTEDHLGRMEEDATPLARFGLELIENCLPVISAHLPAERDLGAEGVAFAVVSALFAGVATSGAHPIHVVRGVGRALGSAFPDADRDFVEHLGLELLSAMRVGQANSLLSKVLQR